METILTYIIGGGLIALVGFILNNNREQDKKIARSYERLDVTKKYQDETFTRKDICAVLHKQIADDLSEIKLDLKILVRNGSQYQGKEGIQGPRGEPGKDGKDRDRNS